MQEMGYDGIWGWPRKEGVRARHGPVRGLFKMDGQGLRVLLEGGQGEVVEKKSRFIATLRRTESEEEANAFIGEMKKKYWDASHNCSAFVIGRRGELKRCSDDGEPGGTAGRPMLETLLGEGLHNVTVVVTRYFGGTLLGTGGLARAYARAVKEGLAQCKVGVERLGLEACVWTDYNDLGRIQYLLGQNGVVPIDSVYTDKVCLKLLIPLEEAEALRLKLVEATGGRVKWEKSGEYYFVDKDRMKS